VEWADAFVLGWRDRRRHLASDPRGSSRPRLPATGDRTALGIAASLTSARRADLPIGVRAPRDGRDDRTTIQPKSWLARFHGLAPNFGKQGKVRSIYQFAGAFYPVRWFRWFLGCPAETVEETLAKGVDHVGPLVAIGQPGERYITSGADQTYVSDDRWQDVVQSYLGRSFGVILQPSLTDGVLWEIEQTCRSVPRHRVLFSLVNFQGRPNAYEDLWLLLRDMNLK
jgi:hypothetical protein